MLAVLDDDDAFVMFPNGKCPDHEFAYIDGKGLALGGKKGNKTVAELLRQLAPVIVGEYAYVHNDGLAYMNKDTKVWFAQPHEDGSEIVGLHRDVAGVYVIATAESSKAVSRDALTQNGFYL